MSRILSLVLVLALPVCPLAAQPAQTPDPAPAPATKAPEPATDLSGLDAKALRDLVAQLQRGRQEDAERIAKLEAEVKALKEQVDKAAKPGSDKTGPNSTPAPAAPGKAPAPNGKPKAEEMTSPYPLTARDIRIDGKRWRGQAVLLKQWTFRGIDNAAVPALKGAYAAMGYPVTGTTDEIAAEWIGFKAWDQSRDLFLYLFAKRKELGERLLSLKGGEVITIKGRVCGFADGIRYGVFVDKIE